MENRTAVTEDVREETPIVTIPTFIERNAKRREAASEDLITMPEPADLNSLATTFALSAFQNDGQNILSFARLTRKHKASNVFITDILRWFRTQQTDLCVAVSGSSIPAHLKLTTKASTLETKLIPPDSFNAHIYLKCSACSKWRSRPAFHNPFDVKCCEELPSQFNGHFVLFQVNAVIYVKYGKITVEKQTVPTK